MKEDFSYLKDFPKQKLFGFGRFGEKDPKAVGDCWRCCIAALLKYEAESVPHFVRDSESSIPETQKWLNKRGYWLMQATVTGSERGFYCTRWGNSPEFVSPPVIYTGVTVRSQNYLQTHACIYQRDQLMYDPHPDNSGLLAFSSSYMIVRMDISKIQKL